MVIEEVFGGKEDKSKDFGKGKVKDLEEVEVARVLCWSEDVPSNSMRVEPLTTLEDVEGK